MEYENNFIILEFDHFDKCVEILETLLCILKQFTEASSSHVTNLLREALISALNTLPNDHICHLLENIIKCHGWENQMFNRPINSENFKNMTYEIDDIINRLYAN